MSIYEKRKTPTWRSTEGRLREEAPRREKEGRRHLTGYEPGWSERESDRPREAARLGGSYGDVAVGVSRKKELTVSVSRRRSREGPATTENEKRMKSNGSVKLNRDREDFRTNAGDKKKSAVTYRETHLKTPSFMVEQFKELLEVRDQAVAEEQLAFLDQTKDKLRLQALQSRADSIRAKDHLSPELGAIQREKEALSQQLTEKKSQERRLKLTLARAREESKRMAGETEQARLWDSIFSVMDEPPPEEEKPENQGENGDQEKEKEENL